jgi:hypothetical protein
MQHLAQANILLFSTPLDDPMIKEFVDFLESANNLTEESLGLL